MGGKLPYRPKTPLDVLRTIRDRDPDGDETLTAPPTIETLSAFETWIADTYGLDAVRDYYTEWDTPSDPV